MAIAVLSAGSKIVNGLDRHRGEYDIVRSHLLQVV